MNNTVNQNVSSARAIALKSNYENIYKIVEDVKAIFTKYPHFYGVGEQKPTLKGNIELLVLMGTLTINNSIQKRTETVKVKFTFPREYPKLGPLISLPNPSHQTYDRNAAFENAGLGLYDRNPNDGKHYLYLTGTQQLRSWTNKSDIVKVILEVERKLNENVPFVPRANMNKTGTNWNNPNNNQNYNNYPNKGQYNQGNNGIYYPNQPNQPYNYNNVPNNFQKPNNRPVNNNMDPVLKQEKEKVENQYFELESDFQLLNVQRLETNFMIDLNKVYQHEIVHKIGEFQRNTQQVKKMAQNLEKMPLNANNFEQFLDTQSVEKQIQLISQKQALEQCHQYLKQQLKSGVKMMQIRESLKKVYQEMFVNQHNLNSIV